MVDNEKIVDLSNLNLSLIDFSYSHLQNLQINDSYLLGCVFKKNTFKDISFTHSRLQNAVFTQIKSIDGSFKIGRIRLHNDIFIPVQLSNKFTGNSYMYIGSKVTIFGEDVEEFAFEVFNTLEGLLTYGLQRELFTKSEIKGWFKFEEQKEGKTFFEKIDKLRIRGRQEGEGSRPSP